MTADSLGQMRASDRDRDNTADWLRTAFAEGRLTSAVVGRRAVLAPRGVLVIACDAPGHTEPRPAREISTNSAPKAGAGPLHG